MRVSPVVLAISLVLNLFLVGAIAGGVLFFRTREPVIFAGSLRIADADLASGQAQALRTALQSTRRTLRQAMADRQDALDMATRLMREQTYDEAAVLGALGRLRAANAIIQAAVEARATSFFGDMPQSDRIRVAEAIQWQAQRRTGPLPDRDH